MKRIPLLVSLIAACLLLAACPQMGGPSHAAEQFFNAMAKGDITTAKKFCTEETGKLLDIIQSLEKKTVDEGAKFILIGEEVTGETAVVKFKDRADGEEQQMTLKRVGGEWKVDISKE